MQVTAHEAQVLRLVGGELFRRAVGYARDGMVTGLQVTDGGETLRGRVLGRAAAPYTTKVYLTREAGRGVVDFLGICTCPVGSDCKHAVALMLADAQRPDRGASGDWPAAFDSLLPADRAPLAPAADSPSIALQFDVGETGLTIRPVAAGTKGKWVRSGIAWTDLNQLQRSRTARAATQHRLLAELSALYTVARRDYGYYYSRPAALAVGDLSRRAWDVLAEASAAGIAFVPAKPGIAGVTLHEAAVSVALDVRADEVTGDDVTDDDGTAPGGIVVEPRPQLGGVPLPPVPIHLVGEPAHGAFWIDDAGLHLARLEPTEVDVRGLLEFGRVRVPAGDIDRFVQRYALPLRDSIEMVSSDASVPLPDLGAPTLVLEVRHAGGQLELAWSWRYAAGRYELLVPLGTPPGAGQVRDTLAEADLAARAAAACACLPRLLDTARPARPAPTATLTGADVVTFAVHSRPALEATEGIELAVSGAALDLHESVSPPRIEFCADSDDSAGNDGDGPRDWLDLTVAVRVDDESVPFAELFRALAEGDKLLVLPSGTWFSLDRPEFVQLAELIAESRALHDTEPDAVRVGRYQASIWGDLEDLGTVHGEVAEWRATMAGLLAATAGDDPAAPLPAGLHATLRPYQQAGFEWLARLFEHGLGGVLADEMGLGKTIQCLALFCHARERDPGGPPFLVVAPTSVVSNWAAEAARFAPGLRVAPITGSTRRRRRSLTDIAAGADVVITSYTLLRLDRDEYAGVGWSGLVLDEAQFAKNHHSQAFACAKKLAVPFKLAITGTPMENNLTELWAMFAIAAPGLFPPVKRFEELYRTPIERGRDADLLARLRRRVRPFLLRRTKAEVVAELPAKQEQVLELDLDPKHRKAYQTLLARERRKVLGLLSDLDRNQFEILRSLTILRQASLDVSLVDPEQRTVPSTKLDELLRMIAEIAAEGHRVVVFSQFTRFLDKAQRRLMHAGIDHCYLDGRTRDRAGVITAFKTGDAPVFLISLKAGGFGLNLTEADYCILLDPWWNAAAEAQAVDRVHRIGQTRTVNVYRLVARDTIEAKVMAVQRGKAELFASVMDGGDWTGGRMSADEIRDLLA